MTIGEKFEVDIMKSMITAQSVGRQYCGGKLKMNDYELKRMTQVELIKLIDTGQLIHIDDIKGNNPIVIDRLSNEGYCVLSNGTAQQFLNESCELAKLKIELKNLKSKANTRGNTVWKGIP